jgi:hypothetical protein
MKDTNIIEGIGRTYRPLLQHSRRLSQSYSHGSHITLSRALTDPMTIMDPTERISGSAFAYRRRSKGRAVIRNRWMNDAEVLHAAAVHAQRSK